MRIAKEAMLKSKRGAAYTTSSSCCRNNCSARLKTVGFALSSNTIAPYSWSKSGKPWTVACGACSINPNIGSGG